MPYKNRVVNNLHSHTSRVIHSSMAANVSTNWRSDYYKFKGYSYAQVLKNSSSMGQNQNKGTIKIFPNFAWPSKGTSTRIQLKNSPKVTPKASQVKTGICGPHSGQYFNFKLLDGNEVTLVHLKENVTDLIWLIQHNPQNLRILGHFKMTKVLFLQHF